MESSEQILGRKCSHDDAGRCVHRLRDVSFRVSGGLVLKMNTTLYLTTIYLLIVILIWNDE